MATELRNWTAQNQSQEERIPILMIALMALVAFGLIGELLFTAGSLERQTDKKLRLSPSENQPLVGTSPTAEC